MKEVEFEIPSMQSNHCQTRVSAIIKNHRDISLSSISPGRVAMQVSKITDLVALADSLESSGYKVVKLNLK